MESLLAKLKHIQPNEDFRQRSKQLILSMPQLEAPQPIMFSRLFLTASFAGILLILGGLSLLNSGSPALVDSLDQKQLAQEVQSLEIQIQLSQAQYYEESAKKIEIALNQTSDETN